MDRAGVFVLVTLGVVLLVVALAACLVMWAIAREREYEAYLGTYSLEMDPRLQCKNMFDDSPTPGSLTGTARTRRERSAGRRPFCSRTRLSICLSRR